MEPVGMRRAALAVNSFVLAVAALAILTAGARAETINTLDFFLTKHPDKGLTGTHNLSQTVIGRRSYYVKWGPGNYEVHRIDPAANMIYLEEDHDTGGGAYSLLPGPWMKISMDVGETIRNYDDNDVLRHYKLPECAVDGGQRFWYETTLEAHIPDFDLGGDLGKQDVIVLGYGLPGTGWERDYYSREWGWVKWEAYAGDKTTLEKTSIFNRIVDRPTPPRADEECYPKNNPDAGPPPLPTPVPPPGGGCPPGTAYDDGRPDATATYCRANGVDCPDGYQEPLRCIDGPGWTPYGPDCAPASCTGCACLGQPAPMPDPAPGPAPTGPTGHGCPEGDAYDDGRPEQTAIYCRAGGLDCPHGYQEPLHCIAAPGFQAYGPDCAAPHCGGCACE